MSHTPGPWYLPEDEVTQSPLRFPIQGTLDGWPTDPVCWFGANRTDGENIANAKLIVESPTMLDLLEQVYSQAGNSAPAERRHSLTPGLRDNIRDLLKRLNRFAEVIASGDQR